MSNWDTMPPKLKNFELAFASGSSGCVRYCQCGKTWYSTESGYDWEPGEFERLEKNKNAHAVPYSVGTLLFEGKEYVSDCDCWHKQANTVIGFLDGHNQQIAAYLTLEKKRKQEEATASPTVN